MRAPGATPGARDGKHHWLSQSDLDSAPAPSCLSYQGGCIIRAQFLDRIRVAYERNPELPSLLVDPDFAKELTAAEASWRRVAALSITHGVPIPSMTSSLGYFDTYRRERLPANLVQAQRDFFGSHTYQRFDKEGWYHTVWDETFGSADSITTSGYVV